MERSELERLVEEQHQRSFGWALACCGRNYDDAEEVLQVAYLKILDGRARFDERSAFKTFLFSVIRHTALERFRWKRAKERVALLLHQPVPAEPPDQAAEKSESAAQLERALGKIANRQREVLELVFYHDMTIEEAALTLGIATGTARVHYERGKKQLLQRLHEENRIAFA